MSLDYLRAVFASDFEPYDRLVMLALADRADENGTCYPSIEDICERTGMGERGVQNVVKRLVAGGHISVKWGGGRHQRNTYTLKINPARDAGYQDGNPAQDAPFAEENPARHSENPASHYQNPAPDAGEPLRTIKEPSEEDKRVARFPAPDLSPCFDHFNALAAQVGWSQVQRISPDRKAAVLRRISEVGGQDAWCEAMNRASRSPLLTGNNARGWRADFDWLQKPANFTKLMEGNYDPRPSTSQPNHTRASSGYDSLYAGFAAVAARGSGATQ